MSKAAVANPMGGIRGSNPLDHLPVEAWTTGELEQLRRYAPMGAAVVSEILGRTVPAVRRQAHRQGISLRTAGQRRGRLLGLPNGLGPVAAAAGQAHHLEQLRERVLDGELDPSVIAHYTVWMARDEPLCPSCSKNPAEVERTGWCRPCHLRSILAGEKYEEEIRAAQRENDAARQRKHRERVREA